MVSLSSLFDALRALLNLFPRFFRLITGRSRRRIAAEDRERDYEERLISKTKENATLAAELAEIRKMFIRTEKERVASARDLQRSLRKDYDESERRLRDATNSNDQLYKEVSTLERQLEQKTKLLDQLSKESSEAQRWMSIRDACTDAQIASEVEGLNYEVQNIAMPLGDAMAENMQERAAFVLPANATLPISARALAALQSGNLSNDGKATILGITVQSALLAFCREAAVQWEYGFLSHNAEARSWLDAVFDSVHTSEPAAISGNWRSLAHRHAAHVAANSHGQPEQVILRALLSTLTPIFAGCGFDSARTSELIEESVGMDALTGLVAAIKRLNDNIKQGVISSSLSPIVVSPDIALNVAIMKVGLGGDAVQEATVLSTTGLGLERQERKEDGIVVTTLLSRPEVALNMVLDSLVISGQ